MGQFTMANGGDGVQAFSISYGPTAKPSCGLAVAAHKGTRSQSIMQFFSSIVVLSSTLCLIGCPGGYIPPTATQVLGFATNCGKGATALMTYVYRMNDDDEPHIAIDPTSLRPDDEKVTLGFQWPNEFAPLVVRIGQGTACVFATSRPRLVIEANCYKDYGPLPTCQARLNLQGLIPAPERYESPDISEAEAYGNYPCTPPDELFEASTLAEANARERQRAGDSMGMKASFEDRYCQNQDPNGMKP